MTSSFSITIQPGGKWSAYISRGKSMTLTATGNRANLSTLLFHAPYPSERYNMPDTLKAQHTAMLTAGHVLMSDQGECWHLSPGIRSAGMIRYRVIPPGRVRTRSMVVPATRMSGTPGRAEENLIVEMYRHQLTPRDLSAPVNFSPKWFASWMGPCGMRSRKRQEVL